MASVPQSNLPLFYNDLMPLNSRDHAKWRSVSLDKAPWLVGAHAIPLTVDEFVQAQRDFPIVFSSGDNPLPIMLPPMPPPRTTFFPVFGGSSQGAGEGRALAGGDQGNGEEDGRQL